MTSQSPGTPTVLLEELTELWGILDDLFGSLGPGDWSRKHGKDWTFADVPYHIAYFDHDMILDAIKMGPTLPKEQQIQLRTLNELNGWNAEKFAERPAGQTPEQALEQMQASREAIRELASGMSEADLEAPAWIPIPGLGMTTAGFALEGCRTHTWSHAMELRLRLGRAGPVPSEAISHKALDFFMRFLAATLNKEEAAKRDFTLVMKFTDPGGGAWTHEVSDGPCTTSEGQAEDADLVMTQSVETFFKMSVRMQNPMLAMLTRRMKPSSYRKLPSFMKLFPEPKPDQEIAQVST